MRDAATGATVAARGKGAGPFPSSAVPAARAAVITTTVMRSSTSSSKLARAARPR